MEISGVALAPGIYTGIDGKTIEYPKTVMAGIADTIPGKPILGVHTRQDGDEEVLTKYSAGFFTDAWVEGDQVKYRGYLYNPEAFNLIEKELVDSGSLEIDVKGVLDERRDVYLAKQAGATAMALTDKPAFKGAAIESHKYVTHVRLEEVNRMSEDKPGTLPTDKNWKDMSDKERLQASTDYLKEKGFSAPTTTQSMEVITSMAKAMDVDPVEYRKFIETGLEEGKTIDECVAAWKEEHTSGKHEDPKKDERIQALEDKNKDFAKHIATFQNEKLESRIADIKAVDKDFDSKGLLEGVSEYTKKMALLDNYANFLTTHVPKVKLELGSPGSEPEDLKAKLTREKEMFDSMNFAPDLRVMMEKEYGDKPTQKGET